jgi:hypothetical protein
MGFLTAISILIGAFGIIVSIYYGIKSKRLESKIRRFEWRDIELGTEFIANRAIKIFNPDVILTVSMPGTIIASLIL